MDMRLLEEKWIQRACPDGADDERKSSWLMTQKDLDIRTLHTTGLLNSSAVAVELGMAAQDLWTEKMHNTNTC